MHTEPLRRRHRRCRTAERRPTNPDPADASSPAPVVGPVVPADHAVRITTMGGFSVTVGGRPVPAGAWGSRQARLVCKRLAVALGQPVPRDELVELLWPDEPDPARRAARLSVVLSNVRRVLGGGLVADRASVRLDLDAVAVDLAAVQAAVATGDDAGLVAAYTGPLLPEDAYDDWAIAARERLASAVSTARRRLAAAAATGHRWDAVVAHARGMLELDVYDEHAHELLVRALVAAGRRGEAQAAAERYRARMAELGIEPSRLAIA